MHGHFFLLPSSRFLADQYDQILLSFYTNDRNAIKKQHKYEGRSKLKRTRKKPKTVIVVFVEFEFD